MLVHYLAEIVEPTVKEYSEDPTDKRKCFLACVALYHSVDRIAEDRFRGCKSPQQACQLLKRECPAFSIVEDVALAFKHLKAGGGGRVRLTEDGVLERPPAQWDKAMFDLTLWDDETGGVEARRHDEFLDVAKALRQSTDFLLKLCGNANVAQVGDS